MNKFKVFSLLIVFIGLISCKSDNNKDEPIDPTKANIIGSVNLYDSGVNPVDNSGMKVVVDGTSPEISAMTDSEGKYQLTDVPFGEYDLSYNKEGYGIYKLKAFEHKTDGSSSIIQHSPSLGQKSDTKVIELETHISNTDVVIEANTNPEGNNSNEIYVRFFFSTSNNVSNTKYEYVEEKVFGYKINPLEHILSTDKLSEFGFTSGETVYIRIYGDSFWSNEYKEGEKMVYPNINIVTADAVSFEVP